MQHEWQVELIVPEEEGLGDVLVINGPGRMHCCVADFDPRRTQRVTAGLVGVAYPLPADEPNLLQVLIDGRSSGSYATEYCQPMAASIARRGFEVSLQSPAWLRVGREHIWVIPPAFADQLLAVLQGQPLPGKGTTRKGTRRKKKRTG